MTYGPNQHEEPEMPDTFATPEAGTHAEENINGGRDDTHGKLQTLLASSH